MEDQIVFVYGSLMKGHGNHRLLKNAWYLTEGVTVDTYQFLSFGVYPAVRKNMDASQWNVSGELYKCDKDTMYRLDLLESNGTLYQRHQRTIRLVDGGTTQAWIYEFLMDPWTDADEPDNSDDFSVVGNVAFWLGSDYKYLLREKLSEIL